MRDSGRGAEIGADSGAAVDIIHLKIADQQYWGRMGEVAGLIEAARARGVDVQANAYPYSRGNSNLVSIIPPWAHEGGQTRLLQRLQDPEQRARMKQDIRNGISGWYNHYTAVGGDWSRMLISADNLYQGLTMDRVLGVFAREQKTLRLEEALRKMTSMNAARAGIPDRGLLKPGMFADITIFDPERVIDRATYTDPFACSEGIEHALVNGAVVFSDGQRTSARPGRALHRHTGSRITVR